MHSDRSSVVEPINYYRAAHSNPLIDALPEFDFGPQILEQLSFLPPPPDATVRAEPANRRLRYLGELVRVHVSLNRDRDLAQSVDSMIREGLLARGSIARQRAESVGRTERLVSAASNAATQKTALEALLARAARAHAPAETKALIGVSGVGKTRTLLQVLSLWPRSIAFPAANNPQLPPLQIPSLWVEAPADRTIPSFHAAALQSLQTAIDQEIHQQIRGQNRSERISSLADLLQHFHTGILVIDEVQKLLRANGTPDYILLNFILEIANTLRVPVLFVGTPAAQKLLAAEMRNARRLLGNPWLNFSDESTEWKRLVETIWRYQFTTEYAPLSEELEKTIHQETLGLPGLFLKLFRETQRVLVLANLTAPDSKKLPERITSDILGAVARAIFAPLRPMLSALRSGRLDDIACFEDLALDDRLVEARISELADVRRREFLRTLRTIRSENARQRRRAKATLRQDVDELLGHVKTADGFGATREIESDQSAHVSNEDHPSPTQRNTKSEG